MAKLPDTHQIVVINPFVYHILHSKIKWFGWPWRETRPADGLFKANGIYPPGAVTGVRPVRKGRLGR